MKGAPINTAQQKQLTPDQQKTLDGVAEAQKTYLEGIEKLKAERRAALIRAAHQKVTRAQIGDVLGIGVRAVSTIMNGR